MAKYFLTNLAVEDLTEIWNYTYDNWSEEQADHYYEQLINAFELITNNPSKGKSYEGIANNLLGFKVNRHIIFYRVVNPEQLEITRILHEQMDLERRIQ